MMKFIGLLAVWSAWSVGLVAMAKDTTGPGNGHLVIVGGGLRPNNRAVFEKIVEYAGGAERARFVVLPTASISTVDSYDFCNYLTDYGVSEDRSEVLMVTEQNAATAVGDEAILAKVRAASGVFLSGGDQRRLVRLLTQADGSDTPLLKEIRKVYERGGVIGGTSAGASAQSAAMLAVSGLPDRLVDEGLDTLDFGITSHADQRGLLLTRGFGFFKAGIIDQHFTQFRGRLGRLTRATADGGVPLGFGIDENTALLVASDGPIQIAGIGAVTIVQPGEARGEDGPLGYRIKDVTLTMLTAGDTFDPKTGETTVDPIKPELVTEKAEYDGNFLINDIGAGGAVPFAIVAGLAENTRSVQEGISVKYHGDYVHGYRFVFRKRPTTKAYGGIMDEKWTYSVIGVQLDIVPIAAKLQPAETQQPVDLPPGALRNVLNAVAFRGLLPADAERRFRPDALLTRAEFASALARSTHLTAPAATTPAMRDVDASSYEGDEILRVVSAGLMSIHSAEFQGTKFHSAEFFSGEAAVSAAEVAAGLRRLVELGGPLVGPEVKAEIGELDELKSAGVSRARVGELLHGILKLPK